jgi:hypothetical protein
VVLGVGLAVGGYLAAAAGLAPGLGAVALSWVATALLMAVAGTTSRAEAMLAAANANRDRHEHAAAQLDRRQHEPLRGPHAMHRVENGNHEAATRSGSSSTGGSSGSLASQYEADLDARYPHFGGRPYSALCDVRDAPLQPAEVKEIRGRCVAKALAAGMERVAYLTSGVLPLWQMQNMARASGCPETECFETEVLALEWIASRNAAASAVVGAGQLSTPAP